MRYKLLYRPLETSWKNDEQVTPEDVPKFHRGAVIHVEAYD